jgi:hypothetical protein
MSIQYCRYITLLYLPFLFERMPHLGWSLVADRIYPSLFCYLPSLLHYLSTRPDHDNMFKTRPSGHESCTRMTYLIALHNQVGTEVRSAAPKAQPPPFITLLSRRGGLKCTNFAQKRWPEVASRSRIAPRNQPFGSRFPGSHKTGPGSHVSPSWNGWCFMDLFGAVPRFRRSKGIGKTQHEK